MMQAVQVSNDISDIVAINREQAKAVDGIRIIELSSLSDIIPYRTAEAIRRNLLRNSINVKQLTNHRVFEKWTNIDEYIEKCMDVRYISQEFLHINTELLIFNDVVAMYQLEPEVLVTVIRNANFAEQQKALFDNFWHVADKLELNEDGSTTYGVTIRRTPEEVYDFVSNLANWPQFSEFAADFERVDDDFIPYRVVPNKDGAELLMTNFRPRAASRAEYEEQLRWMEVELEQAKLILEAGGAALVS